MLIGSRRLIKVVGEGRDGWSGCARDGEANTVSKIISNGEVSNWVII
jgi:hypothetical protein